MAKAWVVTVGDYSSYRILAAFLNPEAAESFRKTWGAAHATYEDTNDLVEEYELFASDPGLFPIYRVQASAIGRRSRTPKIEMRIDMLGHSIGPPRVQRPVMQMSVFHYPDAAVYREADLDGALGVTVWADGPDDAACQKVVNDRLAQIVAGWDQCFEWPATDNVSYAFPDGVH